jgi:hypothetical protein
LVVTRHDPEDVRDAIAAEHANGSVDPNAQVDYQPTIVRGKLVT